MTKQSTNSEISKTDSKKHLTLYNQLGQRLSSFVVTRIVRSDKYERTGGVTFHNTNLGYEYRLGADYEKGEYLEVYLTNLTRASNKLASEEDFKHTVPFDISELPGRNIFQVTCAIQKRVVNGIETYGF